MGDKVREKKKRKYYRKCGICGERHEQSNMVRTYTVDCGWICNDCYYTEHIEFGIEEWKESRNDIYSCNM